MTRQRFIYNELLYILLLVPLLFLLVNKFPYFLVTSVLITILLGFLFFLSKRYVTQFHKEILSILSIIYVYFTLSYFFSSQKLSDFFSYSFLEKDGNFFFSYILFFVFAIPALNYKKLARIYFIFIFPVFTLFGIFGIVEYFLGKWTLMVSTESYTGKLFFALNSAHNATGSVYAIVSIFALVFFLKEEKNHYKFIYLVVLIVNIAALFITKSRGSYLAFALGAIFILWFHFKSIKKFFSALGIMILMSLPLIFITGIYKRIFQIFDLSSSPTTIRFELWEKAWYLFSQSPLFGIGFGRFNDIYSFDRNEFIIDRLKGYPGVIMYYANQNFYFDASHAHNSYLQFLAETGIVGTALILVFWILCLSKILKAYLNSNDEFSGKIFLSSASSIVTLLILAFSEHYLSAITIMIPMSILTSLTIGLCWQKTFFPDLE